MPLMVPMTPRADQVDAVPTLPPAVERRARQRRVPISPASYGFRQYHGELAEAQRLARIGSWRWDITDDVVAWSEVLYDIFGLDPAEPPPSYARHTEIYTAESFARLDAAVRAAVTEGTAYSLDLEIRHGSGEPRWITGRGEAIRDASGSIIALRGTTQDITDKRRMPTAPEEVQS